MLLFPIYTIIWDFSEYYVKNKIIHIEKHPFVTVKDKHWKMDGKM